MKTQQKQRTQKNLFLVEYTRLKYGKVITKTSMKRFDKKKK